MLVKVAKPITVNLDCVLICFKDSVKNNKYQTFDLKNKK